LRTLIADKDGSTRLTPFERTLIARVLDLQALSAADLMHPAATADDPPALRIASRTRGDDILPLMRRVRQPVASVFDEATGSIVGVVSEEDVLLALTGVLKEG
jgi:CBS domain containing-hemolysin-like protein